MEHKFDLIVVGCGIAGLATAVSAAESGLKVAVLERATIEDRGGNTRWTEALMRMKNETEVADDLEDHFMANSGFHLDPSLVQEAGDSNENRSAIVRSLGFTDPELISTLSAEAGNALTWLKKFGITYSDMPTYLITQSTTRLMPVGGGWALVEALVKAGENLGVKFFYETTAVKLIQSEDGTVCGLQASNNQTRSIKFMGKVMLAGSRIDRLGMIFREITTRCGANTERHLDAFALVEASLKAVKSPEFIEFANRSGFVIDTKDSAGTSEYITELAKMFTELIGWMDKKK